jgi:hypothetical protein
MRLRWARTAFCLPEEKNLDDFLSFPVRDAFRPKLLVDGVADAFGLGFGAQTSLALVNSLVWGRGHERCKRVGFYRSWAARHGKSKMKEPSWEGEKARC